MKNKFHLKIANEHEPRTVSVTEILLTEKLFEIDDFISWGEGAYLRAETRSCRISKSLGKRLSPDGRTRVAFINNGELHLAELH